jgi:hypothetical protein
MARKLTSCEHGGRDPVYIHLLRAKDLIDRDFARPLDVPALAREANASTAHFRPGPPMMDEETAEQLKSLVAKGIMSPGVVDTDDCRGTYEVLKDRGVNFLSEPTERFYGIEATLRDNSGNWFSLTQRVENPAPVARS